jgi:hypothetical protein
MWKNKLNGSSGKTLLSVLKNSAHCSFPSDKYAKNVFVADTVSNPAEPEVVATLDAEYYYFLEAASRVRLSRQIIYEKNVYNSTGETNPPPERRRRDT